MNVVSKYRDVIAAFVFLVLSAALYHSTGSIRIFAPNSASYINARFFPYLLSIVLGLTSVVELVLAVRKLPSRQSAVAGITRAGVIRVVATLVLLAAYTFFLNILGFLVVTAIYVFLQVLLLTPREKLSLPFALGLAVVSSSVIYFLFTEVLALMLPRASFLPF